MKGLLFFFSVACLISIGRAAASDELIVFLLDTSGSMQGQEQDMVNGVNRVLEEMQQTFNLLENGDAVRFNVQLWTFNEYKKQLLVETTLDKSPRLMREQYKVYGGTPLYDAIGQILQSMPNNGTIVIATDGQDTTSSQFHLGNIRDAIKKAKEERDIQFIFIGQGEDTLTKAREIGLDNDRTHGSHNFAVPIGTHMGDFVYAAPVSTSIQTVAFRHLVVVEEEKK